MPNTIGSDLFDFPLGKKNGVDGEMSRFMGCVLRAELLKIMERLATVSPDVAGRLVSLSRRQWPFLLLLLAELRS